MFLTDNRRLSGIIKTEGNVSAFELQVQLRNVIDSVQRTYREWVDGGLTELSAEDDLWKSFSELAGIGKQATGIAGEYFTAVADFWRKWNAFTRAAHASPDDVNIVSADVWGSWEALEDLRTSELFRQAPALETLAALEKQNVGPNQICEIYGWKDNFGRPMLSRVAEESAKDPKDRITPKNPLQARFDREHAERTEKVTSYRSRAHRKVDAATKPGPESLEELVATGVSAKQIASIKRISTDEVYKLCEEKGLEFPALDYSPGSTPKRPEKGAKPVTSPVVKESSAVAAETPKRGPGRPKKEPPAPANPPAGRKAPPKLPPPPVDEGDADSDDEPVASDADDVIDENIRTYLGAGYQPAEVVQLMKDGGDPVDLARVKRAKAAGMAGSDSEE